MNAVTIPIVPRVAMNANARGIPAKFAATPENVVKMVRRKRGVRFVESEKISTAGGLTSGTDLALRVVERYFGRGVAQATAAYMEYDGKGWIV